MPLNETESIISALAQQSFLKLWCLPNPFHARGKETADLLVPFGDDLLVFSIKASVLDVSEPEQGWSRWYRRTITKSVAQLAGAIRTLSTIEPRIFIDSKAVRKLPFEFGEASSRRLHLIAVAFPDHQPDVFPVGWRPLKYVSTQSNTAQILVPLEIGYVAEPGGSFVHVFDGDTVQQLLQHLDTIPDFVSYLKNREQVLTERRHLEFFEMDLLALSTSAWSRGRGYTLTLPNADADGVTRVPTTLWDIHLKSEQAMRSQLSNEDSYFIDVLIEHFHAEFVAARIYYSPAATFKAHEKALRILNSESRFGRRVIVSALSSIQNEADTSTFWASTVASKDVPGVRYVWLTYPPRPDGATLDDFGHGVLNYLTKHLWVARSTFAADLVIGIAIPNAAAAETRDLFYIMRVLEGSAWSQADEKLAAELRSAGIFSNLKAFTSYHIP